MSKRSRKHQTKYHQFDKRLTPFTATMLGNKRASYVAEIAAWPSLGPLFQTAVEQNLQLTGELFANDTNFQSDFRSTTRRAALPRLAEIWLAAHFLRKGVPLNRIPQGSGRTTDFDFALGHGLDHLTFLIEVGRMNLYDNERFIPNARHLDTTRAIGGIPTQLSQTDFQEKLSSLLNHKAEQFRQSATVQNSLAHGILAWDIGESHIYQLLLEYDRNATAWVRETFQSIASQAHVEYLLCFAMSLDFAGLFRSRLFPLLDDSLGLASLLQDHA